MAFISSNDLLGVVHAVLGRHGKIHGCLTKILLNALTCGIHTPHHQLRFANTLAAAFQNQTSHKNCKTSKVQNIYEENKNNNLR